MTPDLDELSEPSHNPSQYTKQPRYDLRSKILMKTLQMQTKKPNPNFLVEAVSLSKSPAQKNTCSQSDLPKEISHKTSLRIKKVNKSLPASTHRF